MTDTDLVMVSRIVDTQFESVRVAVSDIRFCRAVARIGCSSRR